MTALNTNSQKQISEKFYHYGAIFRLLFRSFISDFAGPFFVFAFPIVYLLVLGSAFNSSGLGGLIALPSLIALVIVSLTINSFPVRMVEYKKSALIKRISITPLSKIDFLLAVVLWYICLCIIASVWIGILDFAIYHQQFLNSPVHLHWEALVIGMLYYVMYGTVLGLMISTFSKTTSTASFLGFFLYVIPGFLSGIFIPLSTLENNATLNFISHFFPTRYIMEIMNVFFPQSHAATDLSKIVWYSWIIPPIFSVAVFGITSYFFSWEK